MKILLISECPVVGIGKRILEDSLSEVGIKETDYTLISLIQTPTRDGDMAKLYEGKGRDRKAGPELVKARNRVKCEIASLKPNVIVTMGAEALTSICEKWGIQKWRGSLLNTPLGKVVPTYNPNNIIHDWATKPVFVFDLRKALSETDDADYIPPRMFLYTNPNMEAIRNYIDDCHKSKLISFDIETESDQITCIGLSYDHFHAMCIPFWFGNSGSLHSEMEEKEIWTLLKFLLEDESVKKIAQNGTYDCEFLKRVYGISVKGFEWDTMLMAHTLYPELPKGLDFLTSIYTDISYYKDKIKSDKMDEYFEYNAKDAIATYQIYLAQKKELYDAKLKDFYKNHVHALIEPIAGMVERGIKFDIGRKEEVKASLESDILRLQNELDVEVGHPLNINSSKQMSEWLYGELKLPKKTKLRKTTGKQTITTDSDALKELYAKTGNESLRKVIEIREKKKLVSTYLSIQLDKDKRMRCSYNISRTETGRLSSSATARGTGTNLQNIPRGIIKSLFIADEGYKLIEADLSQAEARVVAHLAGESRLIKIFEDGGDIHRKNAAVIYGVSEDTVTREQRQLAKTVVHASNYGMGVRTFAKSASIPEKEADRLLKQYFATYPRIKLWHQSTAEGLRRTRMLWNPFGRRRIFFNQWDDRLVKEGLAFVPQSTVADLVNLAIIRIHSKIKERDNIQLLLQVHDSIVAQAKEEIVQEAVKMLRNEMAIPVTINGKTFTIPVDVKIGKNWSEMEKVS